LRKTSTSSNKTNCSVTNNNDDSLSDLSIMDEDNEILSNLSELSELSDISDLMDIE